MKHNLLILIMLLSVLSSWGATSSAVNSDSIDRKVKFAWGGEFATFFDNREGSGKHTRAETYFLTRLSPEIGISFDNGHQRVMGGVVWVQPIGAEWDGYKLSPTLYYRYEGPRVQASLGMFPRTQLIRQLPDYLESDSLKYYQHNIRGGLIQYQDKRGYFEAFIDWRGMQSEKRREAFAIIAQGEWKHHIWSAGGHAMLNHLALARHAVGQNVIDNIVANPYVGVDFLPLLGENTKWRSLWIEAGVLASLSRDRGDWEWVDAVAFRCDATAEWWRFRLHNSLTAGNRPLFPFYNKFGSLLHEGRPYFKSKFYDRIEVGALLVKYKDIVNLNAELDFHLAPSDFMFCQKLTVTVNF